MQRYGYWYQWVGMLCLSLWMGVAHAGEGKLIQVNPHGHYRVVYDIHTNATIAGGVSKGLYYVRGLFEAYAKQGVKPKQVAVYVVMHDEAAKFLLNNTAYQRAVADEFAVNVNNKIVDELLKHGVHVEICHSTMNAMGWTAQDLLPGVEMVHDAYTRIIQLQNAGYALVADF